MGLLLLPAPIDNVLTFFVCQDGLLVFLITL